MPQTPRSSFRLAAETLEQMDQVGRAHDGLSRTRVIELAVTMLYNHTFPGRAAAPPRARTELHRSTRRHGPATA